MKFRRKKKEVESESLVAESPSEEVNSPVEFITMQELLAKANLTGLDEGGEGPESEIDESPKWDVQIDGMIPMEAGGTKFSVFTLGESASGQMVVEFKTKPGVNSALFGWLQKPNEKKVRMVVRDHEDNRIEQWEMSALPVAIAVDELDREVKDPWFTTLQMSVKNVKIT
jgi:hypothetical protein